DYTGIPPGSAASGRWLDGVDVEVGAHDQPRDQRVRVPHLAGGDLVAAPPRCRPLRDELEEPLGDGVVLRQPLRTGDGLLDVGDHAVAPTADFVAKEAEGAREPRPDG